MKAMKLILILTTFFASQTVLADQEVATEKSLGEKTLTPIMVRYGKTRYRGD